MQPISDSIHNFAVCDDALMGGVQTLPSSGGYTALTSFAAAAPSNPGGRSLLRWPTLANCSPLLRKCL
eukprot:16450222-Heterocapsa_arctica.AAC.1